MKRASSPACAAARKFPSASENASRSVRLGKAAGPALIRPIKKAALEISSSTVGPEVRQFALPEHLEGILLYRRAEQNMETCKIVAEQFENRMLDPALAETHAR